MLDQYKAYIYNKIFLKKYRLIITIQFIFTYYISRISVGLHICRDRASQGEGGSIKFSSLKYYIVSIIYYVVNKT